MSTQSIDEKLATLQVESTEVPISILDTLVVPLLNYEVKHKPGDFDTDVAPLPKVYEQYHTHTNTAERFRVRAGYNDLIILKVQLHSRDSTSYIHFTNWGGFARFCGTDITIPQHPLKRDELAVSMESEMTVSIDGDMIQFGDGVEKQLHPTRAIASKSAFDEVVHQTPCHTSQYPTDRDEAYVPVNEFFAENAEIMTDVPGYNAKWKYTSIKGRLSSQVRLAREQVTDSVSNPPENRITGEVVRCSENPVVLYVELSEYGCEAEFTFSEPDSWDESEPLVQLLKANDVKTVSGLEFTDLVLSRDVTNDMPSYEGWSIVVDEPSGLLTRISSYIAA